MRTMAPGRSRKRGKRKTSSPPSVPVRLSTSFQPRSCFVWAPVFLMTTNSASRLALLPVSGPGDSYWIFVNRIRARAGSAAASTRPTETATTVTILELRMPLPPNVSLGTCRYLMSRAWPNVTRTRRTACSPLEHTGAGLARKKLETSVEALVHRLRRLAVEGVGAVPARRGPSATGEPAATAEQVADLAGVGEQLSRRLLPSPESGDKRAVVGKRQERRSGRLCTEQAGDVGRCR